MSVPMRRLFSGRRSGASLARTVSLALAACVLVLCSARAASLEVHRTHFSSLPAKLHYFEDSTAILWHDAHNSDVWRSADEGKSWSLVEGVPGGEARYLLEHSFDAKTAFIFGPDKKHWRTIDRGQTWQEFTTPLPYARNAVPLSFHADRWDWIIFTGMSCQDWGPWGSKLCHDETFYTLDAFASDPHPLMTHTSTCIWSKSTKDFSSAHEKLIFCIAFEDIPGVSKRDISDVPFTLIDEREFEAKDSTEGWRLMSKRAGTRDSRLFASEDFFTDEKKLVDLGLGRDARGFYGIGSVKKYIVTALKDRHTASRALGGDEMSAYVTQDGVTWVKANFPHGHGLRENAYTIVESTTNSLMVDVLTDPTSSVGTLFTSDSEGTNFVKSLEGTSRNSHGIVDFEHLVGIEGVGLANIVRNPQEGRGKDRRRRTMITYDDGEFALPWNLSSRWQPLHAPERDIRGHKFKCDVNDVEKCSLHLHSVTTTPHNFGRVFSSPAPGFVMGVGSVGEHLRPYEECDTFLSIDAGVTWQQVSHDAHKYEFGDKGALLVMVNDEERTDDLKYSWDMGKTWSKVDLGVKLRVQLLTTVPDSTSQKFLVVGTQSRKDRPEGGRYVAVFIDFATAGKRECGDGDLEKWYARSAGVGAKCLMGHKQYYLRRKPDAGCFVGDKFKEPVQHNEENCPCTNEDYECDYNFALQEDGKCIPAGPERIPIGACQRETDKYMGSSGYRKIPGNTCDAVTGVKLDEKKEKDCKEGQAAPGQVSHQVHEFPGAVVDYSYFGGSKTVIVQVTDGSIWISHNEGFSWKMVHEKERFLTFMMHPYSNDRAHLITSGRKVWYTTNQGINWDHFTAPAEANGLGLPILDYHPERPDWIIWTGSEGCSSSISNNCHTKAFYSTRNGRTWEPVDEYVRTCSWGRDKMFKIDERIIFCESYAEKSGNQAVFGLEHQLQLIAGTNFYKSKTTLFESIRGFATFEEYMVVAELNSLTLTLKMYVSKDGKNFAETQFPPNMRLEDKAYTVLDSVTDSIFLHVTTHSTEGSEWGTLFKSDSNGTHYTMSLEHANRNTKGYVDFEKMQGLDGIAVVNIVGNADDASVTGNKQLQTRITHNDGGKWKPLVLPSVDVYGNRYDCHSTRCALHLHGYTERNDPRTTYSSPTAVGLMVAVGNVGEHLAPYTSSDTFLTRDGGFTWEEIHKDAHLWEFGDQGSILVLVNDEGPTDRVIYSTDEGLTWKEYSIGEPIRVSSIATVPEDTSRKFILFGKAPRSTANTVAIYLDFSKITDRKCNLDLAHPDNDDFELWSPSEEREERCLFGRQTHYHRRIRDANCYVGEKIPQPLKIEKNCACTHDDFECEVNHFRNKNGDCELIPVAQPLATDVEGQCGWGVDYYYDRTAYRKIPMSSCEAGLELHRGTRHLCPSSIKRHGFFFWATIILTPFILGGLVGYWWLRKRSGGYGQIRLPDPSSYGDDSFMSTLASVPWFVVGVAGAVWGHVSEWLERLPFWPKTNRGSYGGYRHLSMDEDAEILQNYEED